MEYITHRRMRGMAAFGERMNIPYGTKFETIGEWIATGDSKAICAVHSEISKMYFARNDDGRGLERGALTWAIAYSPRQRKHKDGHVYRFSEDEIELLERHYSHWLRQDVGTILFNDDFFDAQVPELKMLANALNIKTK